MPRYISLDSLPVVADEVNALNRRRLALVEEQKEVSRKLRAARARLNRLRAEHDKLLELAGVRPRPTPANHSEYPDADD